MGNRLRHIFCLVSLLTVCFVAFGQDRMFDERLDEYEQLCRRCMELKSRTEAGETVSRSEARSLIDSFISMNKELKAHEDEMTVVQRMRFRGIGRWFASGEEPECSVCSLPAVRPVVTPHYIVSADMTDLRPAPVYVPEDGECNPARRGYVCLLASIAAPDMAYGLMAGYRSRKVGGYVSFRSSFAFGRTSYSCRQDGIMDDGGRMWPTGKERKSNLSACAGLLMGISDAFALYGGAGYGFRRLAWEDLEGSWVQVSDWSYSGVAAECGAVMSWKRLAFSAGVSTVAFRTASFTCGLGIRF